MGCPLGGGFLPLACSLLSVGRDTPRLGIHPRRSLLWEQRWVGGELGLSPPPGGGVAPLRVYAAVMELEHPSWGKGLHLTFSKPQLSPWSSESGSLWPWAGHLTAEPQFPPLQDWSSGPGSQGGFNRGWLLLSYFPGRETEAQGISRMPKGGTPRYGRQWGLEPRLLGPQRHQRYWEVPGGAAGWWPCGETSDLYGS